MRAFPARRVLFLVSVALFLLMSYGCSNDGSGWESVVLRTDAEFYGIHFLDRQNGWIVGGGPFTEGGLVGHTTDGGASWDFDSGLVHTSSHSYTLNDVHFFDDLRGCIVGDGGRVLLTDDGGETWRTTRHGRRVSEHLWDICFVDESNGWITGMSGVLRTTDGGESWSFALENQEQQEYTEGRAIQFLDLDDGWMAGKFGVIYHTVDGGRKWTRLGVLGTEDKPHLVALHFPDPDNGWIVGEEGTILHTDDGGDHWVRQSASTGAFLTGVQFVDALQGWIVGYVRADNMSYVFHTVDGGLNWIVDATLEGNELSAFFVLDADHAWSAGNRESTEPQRMLRRYIEPVDVADGR